MRISRNTIRKYSCGDPAFLAEYNSRAFIRLEPFQEEIISLLNNKVMRKDVYRSIVMKGHTGGISQFYEYCKHLADMGMVVNPGNLRIDELCDEQTKVKYHYVTRNQIFKYIWNGEAKSDIRKKDMELIKSSFPVVQILNECLYQFRNIFEAKSEETLVAYLLAYKDCELVPIKKYAESLQKDIASVTNAVVEEYSNGFVEGTNNKLKLIKRVAYGRCKLPLLRAKIVLPAFFWP